jgi:acetyl esterase
MTDDVLTRRRPPRLALRRLEPPRVDGRTAAVLSEGFFRSLSRLGRLHPASRPARHNVEVFENIEYLPGGGVEHRLDIYRPTEPVRDRSLPLPVVLYVHGGGFCTLSKDTHWLMGLMFARFGYLVCNISYRLAPRHPFPAALADTCAAFEWVVRHAPAYGGDVTRLVLAGESAGANLVTALTLATCFERPEPWAARVHGTGITPAVTVPFCGLLEVSNPERFARRRSMPPWVSSLIHMVSDAYLGGATEHEPGFFDLANPLTTLERAHERGHEPDRPLPPFFVPVGTRDPLLDDTRRLGRVLRRMGVACQDAYYPGEVHAFQALVWRKQARKAWSDTFQFLDRHLPRP